MRKIPETVFFPKVRGNSFEGISGTYGSLVQVLDRVATERGRAINDLIGRLGVNKDTKSVTSGPYALLLDDQLVFAAGTFTVDLYSAVGRLGQEFTVINTGAGTITLDGNGTEKINGNLTEGIPTATRRTLVSDGSNWWIKST